MVFFKNRLKQNEAAGKVSSFWNLSQEQLLSQLKSTPAGLKESEAKERLVKNGSNSILDKKENNTFGLLLSQFKSPIIMILIFATLLSFYLRDIVDAGIILAIILISGLLSFWQENSANNAVAKLLNMVSIKADVLRDNQETSISVEQIVSGDIIMLKAGDIIPADCLLLQSNILFVDESTLTGETYPVEKEVGVLPEQTGLSQRNNSLWMGTHVVSGSATAVVANTGKSTEFGEISERLMVKPAETEFEKGIRSFGFLLMKITGVLVVSIFGINVVLQRPLLESFLFSLALAVGLTPQLLPAIISINLSHGAKKMAKDKVIVKRLASIENFGSMDILCSDKTGTITDGIVKIQAAYDAQGNEREKVFLYAYLNASFETGFLNPIDDAIRSFKKLDIGGYKKLDEEPYDFTRKRLSILFENPEIKDYIMITKGALKNVLAVCTKVELSDGTVTDIAAQQANIERLYEDYSSHGYRTLGVAYKDNCRDPLIERDHETDMTFLGFISLFDPPKQGASETIKTLKKYGVDLKIITGDNKLIAANVMQQLGFSDCRIMTGNELIELSDTELIAKTPDIDVFAEVEPNQKERIIIALRKAGFVVGYIGDGINDVSGLHAADVSISVESAVDVAKEAADIVLLEKNLDVLINGVLSGRITFANTMKYIFMATSANFGNMFSMAGASLFLSFLPLLPKQVLLTNLLTDFPEMTIATDTVDDEMTQKPRRWDMGFIRRFMMTFGLISSIFDYLTFGALLFIAHATQIQFRTGWFMESVISASLIVLVIRSRKPFFKSRPGKYLVLATSAIFVATLLLPYSPLAGPLGFEALPPLFIGMIGVIVALYILTAEIGKRIFYSRIKNR